MYQLCTHEDRWLKKATRGYSTRQTREVALLNRMLTYATERRGTVRGEPDHNVAREDFQALADKWRTETAHLSSIAAKVSHPAYLRIIGLGPVVIPLVLRRLETEPAYWFTALRSLTGFDPTRPEDAGSFASTRAAWLQWGQLRGLI